MFSIAQESCFSDICQLLFKKVTKDHPEASLFPKSGRLYLPDYQRLEFSTNLLLISSCFKEINRIFAIHKFRHKTDKSEYIKLQDSIGK